MAIITYPYTIPEAQYGTFSSTYSWYVQWYQYPTNTSTIVSLCSAIINSATVVETGVQVSITINNTDNISRVGTSGYTAPTFTYKSLPTITLTNTVLGESVTVYNTEISVDVVAGSSGNTTTGQIVHAQTLDVIVPETWFATANIAWTFNVSELVTIVTETKSQTNTRNVSFEIAPPTYTYNMTVKYNGELKTASKIWIRKDDILCPIETITVKM